MKSTKNVSTIMTPFALALPKELTIEPRWVIDMPAKHKVLVFDTTMSKVERKDGKETYKQIPAYRVVLVNGKGVERQAGKAVEVLYGHYRGHGEYGVFSDPLDLKLVLERCALALTPTTTTSRRSREIDEDDLGYED